MPAYPVRSASPTGHRDGTSAAVSYTDWCLCPLYQRVRSVGAPRFELGTSSPPDWRANQAAPRPATSNTVPSQCEHRRSCLTLASPGVLVPMIAAQLPSETAIAERRVTSLLGACRRRGLGFGSARAGVPLMCCGAVSLDGPAARSPASAELRYPVARFRGVPRPIDRLHGERVRSDRRRVDEVLVDSG